MKWILVALLLLPAVHAQSALEQRVDSLAERVIALEAKTTERQSPAQGLTLVYAGIGVLAVWLVILTLLLLKALPKKAPILTPSQKQQLSEMVQIYTQQGYNAQQTRQALIQQGWTLEQVKEGAKL